MPRLMLTALTALWPVMAPAETARGAEPDILERLRWQARPIVVLGPPDDVAGQVALLEDRRADLAERDVVVLTDGPGVAALRDGPGFRLLLIGKDGGVKLDRRAPVAVDTILSLIDSMPMRRREAE